MVEWALDMTFESITRVYFIVFRYLKGQNTKFVGSPSSKGIYGCETSSDVAA